MVLSLQKLSSGGYCFPNRDPSEFISVMVGWVGMHMGRGEGCASCPAMYSHSGSLDNQVPAPVGGLSHA